MLVTEKRPVNLVVGFLEALVTEGNVGHAPMLVAAKSMNEEPEAPAGEKQGALSHEEPEELLIRLLNETDHEQAEHDEGEHEGDDVHAAALLSHSCLKAALALRFLW